jgi:hypothetical protein
MVAPFKRGGVRLQDVPDTAPTPVTYNVELEASGTVYTQAITGPLYGLEIQASGSYDIDIAFTAGELPNKGWTVFSGGSYSKEFDAPWPDLTVYVTSDRETVGNTGKAEDSRGAQILVWQDDNTYASDAPSNPAR